MYMPTYRRTQHPQALKNRSSHSEEEEEEGGGQQESLSLILDLMALGKEEELSQVGVGVKSYVQCIACSLYIALYCV